VVRPFPGFEDGDVTPLVEALLTAESIGPGNAPGVEGKRGQGGSGAQVRPTGKK
jgi:hypothetical protein